ncbi:MAG: MFS transporter [Bifidobacteriaceae bacterium]|jgi:MFS family permease|nr:MFS transporter [Bifidobacteriaceae bacterium]
MQLEKLSKSSLKRMLIARACISFTFQMLAIGAGQQIYMIHKSAFDLAYIGLAAFLPLIFCMMPAGILADKHNKKINIIISQIICFISGALLIWLTLSNHSNVFSYLVLIFLYGCGYTIQGPSVQATLPRIVTKEDFPTAIAKYNSASQIAKMTGPAAAGLIYIIHPAMVYAVICIMNTIAICVIMGLKIDLYKWGADTSDSNIPDSEDISKLHEILLGFEYIWKNKSILGTISLDLFAVLFGGATALLPIYANDILKVGPVGLGILRTAPAIGALIVTLIIAKRGARSIGRNVGYKMFGAVFGFAAFTALFGVSTNFALSIFALILLGAFDMISVTIRQIFIQIKTPDELRGRVSSVNFIFVGTSNQLGEFESGMVAGLIGTVPSVLFGAAMTIATAGLWMFLFPDLRKLYKLN